MNKLKTFLERKNVKSFPEKTNTSIDILNDDCLEHVFKFLPIVDRIRSENVCRRWKAVSERSWYLVETLDLSPAGWGFPTANKIHEALFRKIILKCGKYISEIFYTAEYPKLLIHFEKRLPNYISRYCPNVTNLDLTAILLFPRDVEIIAENCRKIKRLRLKLYLISSYQYELTKLFEKNKDLEDIGLEKMSFLCRSLTKLPEHKMKTIMLECYIHFENELFSQILERQKNLKYLYINATSASDSIMETIGRHCKNLELLKICFFSNRQRDIRMSTNLINLKSFIIQRSPKVNSYFIQSLAEVCKELLFLDIKGSEIVDSDLKIIGNIEKLEKLNISKTEITDNGLQYIYGLKKLICQDCMKINNSGIKKLIESSPNLELLDIRGCKRINKIYINEIAAYNNRFNNVSLTVLA